MLKKLFIALFPLIALTLILFFSQPVSAAGVPSNPWHYDFNKAGGSEITNPPADFCSVFPCIGKNTHFKSFWAGSGYVVECLDGTFSKSGGQPGGVCSSHGNRYVQILYMHAVSKPATNQASSNQTTTSSPSPDLPYTGSDPTK